MKQERSMFELHIGVDVISGEIHGTIYQGSDELCGISGTKAQVSDAFNTCIRAEMDRLIRAGMDRVILAEKGKL